MVLSCLVNLAFSATVQVPAGINPADCPGYPNCPFYLLTNNRPANQPADTVYELCPGYPICDNAALHNAAGPALSAPAGVDISKCPGYPFQQCNWWKKIHQKIIIWQKICVNKKRCDEYPLFNAYLT